MAAEKIQIFKLAKELDMGATALKELIQEKIDPSVKSHMSAITQEQADKARELVKGTAGTAKPEVKSEPKSEVKPEVKTEAKTEVNKSEPPKIQPKQEAKPELKPEIKQESKPESKKEEIKKEEQKPAPKSVEPPKVQTKPEPKPETKVEPKKQEPKPEPKSFIQDDPKEAFEDDDDDMLDKYGVGNRDKKNKNRKKRGKKSQFVVKTQETNTSEIIEEDGIKMIKIRGEITVGDFAAKLGVGSSEIIKKMFMKGQMLTINSPLPLELAEEIAESYDAIIEQEEEQKLGFGEKFDLEIEDKTEDLELRPPVITIMGHVDHGKTSLLDAIRSTNVVEGEAGGITQKIGAYQVIKEERKITFVDTPGHEAFTDMRARGAQVTDIAILVVAADDGVMPQTIEAIAHAKAAKVPVIVAVNKIDKPDANPMRVKQELSEQGIVTSEWGGDTEFVEVSAKQKLNLDELLDTILVTADLLELKANPKKRAKGVVLESRLDPKVGPIADIIVQEGTLKIGDVIVAGETSGKVRALVNDKGDRIERAELSQPVEVIGFNDVPTAGDTMYVIQNEQHAKKIVEEMAKERKLSETKRKSISLESLSSEFEQESVKELNLVLRADSRGSVDALRDTLEKLSNDEVAVNIIQSAAGAITESDVKLAGASGAIIIGFNVRPTTKAIKEAETAGVEIRTSNIIYHITEDIEKALSGMLAPEFREEYLGRIEIKKIFKISKIGNIAGCMVDDGRVKRESNVRIIRNGVVVYEGKLASLKRYKDDVKEVEMGQECGLSIENYNDIKEGDIVEAYEIKEITRTLQKS